MKKHKAIKLGVITLLVFTMAMVWKDVTAETKVKACEDSNETLIKKYNVQLKQNDDNDLYTLSIDTSSANKKDQDIVFTVTRINGVPLQEPYTISNSKPKKDLNPTFITATDNGDVVEKATIEMKAAQKDPKCDIVLTKEIIRQGSPYETKEDFITENIGEYVSTTDGIDCNKSWGSTTFEYKFCEVKKNALATTGTQELGKTNKFDKNKKFSVKCKYNSKSTKEDYYAENKTYYYGVSEMSVKASGPYTYEFSPGTIVEGDLASCKVKCEEAIVVEYGPPVASKAGLCFEYKVKVTSRVSCNMQEKPQAPAIHNGYCTPSPVCTGTGASGTYVVTEGGPSEEFDQCINQCDGGKYSQKCSKKCYNKVYGNTNEALNTLTGGTIAQLADNNECKNGCYYRSTNGRITWRSGGDKQTPGRWYQQRGADYWYNRNYIVDSEGIFRHDYGSHICNDTCWWTGCSGKYLNPGFAQKDYEKNKELYEQTVKSCQAAASCNSATATFTISVDYKVKDKDGVTTKTIDFPYDTKKDMLTSKGTNEIKDTINVEGINKDNGISTDKNDEETSILSYGGCYNTKDAKRWYMTEWSFPGTWTNNKTGEISFVEKKREDGWYKDEDKFCIPLNALDVNSKWWEWRVNGTGNITEDDIEDWNIRATARHFGHFEWNLDISCFYGLKSTATVNNGEGYEIRAVKLSDMFPNSGEDVATTKQRDIGFNWTSAAATDKNGNYNINPEKLIEQIQQDGNSVYSDEYLDYQFHLTPETLKSIREYNKNNDFGDYEKSGKTYEADQTGTGIRSYYSNFIRNSKYAGDNAKINKSTGVNNAHRSYGQ